MEGIDCVHLHHVPFFPERMVVERFVLQDGHTLVVVVAIGTVVASRGKYIVVSPNNHGELTAGEEFKFSC